jgi:hypothetical protein
LKSPTSTGYFLNSTGSKEEEEKEEEEEEEEELRSLKEAGVNTIASYVTNNMFFLDIV